MVAFSTMKSLVNSCLTRSVVLLATVLLTGCQTGLRPAGQHVVEIQQPALSPEEGVILGNGDLSVSMVKHSDRTRKDFEDHVQSLPEVMECFSVSGDRDYVLHIVSRDMESYNDFLNRHILDHPSVHSASSSFALRRVKYTTALPL